MAENRYWEKIHYDHFRPMVDYCIQDGEILVDEIFLLDNIDTELQAIEDKIGRAELPRLNHVRDYEDLRTPANVDHVYTLYERDKAMYESVLESRQSAFAGVAFAWHQALRPRLNPQDLRAPKKSKASSAGSTSAAILCIARYEHPFAREWLEYHLSIGFDNIHLVSTDDEFSAVQAIYESFGFGERVSVHHFDAFYPGWQMAAYTEFFPLIEEEWVLIIDLDEFLYLNSTGNIKTLLSSIGDCVGQVQFPWLNLFSNKYHEDSTFGIVSQSRKYASNHVKANHYHDRFVLDLSYYQQHAFILHFFSRGHFDILNRITGHKFFNGNCGDPEKVRLRQLLTGRPSWRNLPNRYFLMKVLQELPQVEVEINLPELGATTDADMLHDIFRKTVRTTVDFVGGDRSDMQREFENQFLLDHKLASFNLDGKVDLEGFFE